MIKCVLDSLQKTRRTGDYELFLDNVKVIKDYNNDISGLSIEQPAINSIKVTNTFFPTSASFKNQGLAEQNNINVALVITDSATGNVLSTSQKQLLHLRRAQSSRLHSMMVCLLISERIERLQLHSIPAMNMQEMIQQKYSSKLLQKQEQILLVDNGDIFSSMRTASPRPTYGWENV